MEVHSRVRRPAWRTRPASRRASGRVPRAVRAPLPPDSPGWMTTLALRACMGCLCRFRGSFSCGAGPVVARNCDCPRRRHRADRQSRRRDRDARADADRRGAGAGDRHRPCGHRAQRRGRCDGPAALPRGTRPRPQRRAGPDHGRLHPRRREQSHAGARGRRADQPGHDRARGAAEPLASADRAHRDRQGPALGAVRVGCDRRRDQRDHATWRARRLGGRSRLR